MGECTHEDTDWDPVEVQYADDEVHVWQEGRCNACKRLVQREYEPKAPHTVIQDAPEEEEDEHPSLEEVAVKLRRPLGRLALVAEWGERLVKKWEKQLK